MKFYIGFLPGPLIKLSIVVGWFLENTIFFLLTFVSLTTGPPSTVFAVLMLIPGPVNLDPLYL